MASRNQTPILEVLFDVQNKNSRVRMCYFKGGMSFYLRADSFFDL
jgi:hypothetical protein